MKVFICLLCLALGVIWGYFICKISNQKRMVSTYKISCNNYERFEMAYNWLIAEKKKAKISDYLKNNGVDYVSIYGYSKLAKVLIQELEENDIIIDYIIDQNADKYELKYQTYKLSDDVPKTKLIIITIPDAADIREKIREKRIGSSITLNDLLRLYV